MASKVILKKRLDIKQEQLEEAYKAYTALLKGGVKSYAIGTRNLTKFDLPQIEKNITTLENEVDYLENQLAGRKPRKAIGVVPRDF